MDLVYVILMFPGNVVVFKLDSSRDLSITLLNLTRTGWGPFECSLYLPSCKWSRIDRGLMLMSVLAITEVTSFRSYFSLSYLGCFFTTFFNLMNHNSKLAVFFVTSIWILCGTGSVGISRSIRSGRCLSVLFYNISSSLLCVLLGTLLSELSRRM